MKTYTVDSIMTLKPCYSHKQIKEWFGDKKEVSALDVVNADHIPIADRLWLLWRGGGDHIQPALDRVVTRAIESYALTSNIPVVRQWAKRWLSGEDQSEQAARAAAEMAGGAAASAVEAAVCAAWAAKWAAWATEVETATWAAARSAAWAAAESAEMTASLAVTAAAWEARLAEVELNQQLLDIKQTLMENPYEDVHS